MPTRDYRKYNIRFLSFILGSSLLLLIFCQYEPSLKQHEPKKQNIYGVRSKTVEVDLEQGEKKFCITYEGNEMDLDLKDNKGNRCELAVNNLFESYPGEKITEIKSSGKYYLDVKAAGFWQVTIIDNN
jgi:hypothetical protein